MSRGLYEACQNGLLEDHPGDFRIEAVRPGGLLISRRPGEVRQFTLVELGAQPCYLVRDLASDTRST